MLKHHCSAFFISSHPAIFSLFSSTKQLRPAIVSPLSVAETPLASNPFHSFMMLKHHRSTLFDFLPILKHQLSAVLHLQQLFRFFSVAETPAFQSSVSKLLRSQMFAQQTLDIIKSRCHNSITTNKNHIRLVEQTKW
jgi:hypothetical protein